MLKRHRGSMLFVALFVLAAFVGVAAVEAGLATGQIVLTRKEKPATSDGARELFSLGSENGVESCSGWCTASVCGCSGSSSCCEAGCNLCWDIFFPL